MFSLWIISQFLTPVKFLAVNNVVTRDNGRGGFSQTLSIVSGRPPGRKTRNDGRSLWFIRTSHLGWGMSMNNGNVLVFAPAGNP
jgi:hypothetical protein